MRAVYFWLRWVLATGLLNTTVFEDPGLDAGAVDALVSVLRDLRRDAGDFGGS